MYLASEQAEVAFVAVVVGHGALMRIPERMQLALVSSYVFHAIMLHAGQDTQVARWG